MRRWISLFLMTVSLLTAGNNTASVPAPTTASISPAPNALVLAWVYTADFTAAVTPALAGNGLTWVQVGATQVIPGGANISLWRAMGSSPTPGVVTITVNGSNPACCYWSILQDDDVTTTGTNGSGAIVQSVPGVAVAAGLTISLAALESSGSKTFGGFANRSGDNATPGAGYTEISDQAGAAGLNSGLEVQYKLSGTTSVSCSGITAGSDVGGIAVEVRPAPSTAQLGADGGSPSAMIIGSYGGGGRAF